MIIGLKKRVILFDKIPCNLQKATVEPEKVMAPTIPPRISAGEKVCMSPIAIQTTAPPPRPLRSATICGNDVILIFSPKYMPMSAPKMIADIKYCAF